MQAALGVVWETLKDWYNGMVGLAALNMLWIGSGLTVVLLAPATAGLAAVTNSIAHGTGQHFEDFKDGAQAYLWISLRWLMLNAIVVALLAVNTVFYGAIESPIGPVVQVLVATLAVLWLAAQLYVWPFLMEQDDKRLRLALRNAVFLALGTPVYTLTLLAVAALVVILSAVTILPLAVFTASFLSLLGNRAVIERLTTFGKLPTPAQPTIDGDQQ
ncbi:DUF624 domain-containing protein [Aggregatilinea lenta]|uniref:DUF624 domain-containing protein n=1 Tax=Aggregatilinea lenta TaxID=913108 RepID=UPI000E5B815C|nr:hypothetical protein [Aggregatilinea lenta]